MIGKISEKIIKFGIRNASECVLVLNIARVAAPDERRLVGAQ